MGLYDRDYSREGSWLPPSPWSRAESRLSMTAVIIIVNVVIFFIDMILSGSMDRESVLADWFGVAPDAILKPWTWYQFLTYGFVHSQANILHLAFNMLGLYFFGGFIEQRLGRSEFLRFYLVAMIVGGIVHTVRLTSYALLTGQPPATMSGGVVGASGAVIAATILFAFLEPNATIYFMAVFPVKAWVMAILFVAMNVLGWIGSDSNVAYDVHLAGVAFAAVYHRRGWRLDQLGFGKLPLWLNQMTGRSPRLRIHDPERKMAQQEAEADRLLDKIQAQGLDSLTKAERKILEKHSLRKRQMRGK